jgi:hypothetical protein
VQRFESFEFLDGAALVPFAMGGVGAMGGARFSEMGGWDARVVAPFYRDSMWAAEGRAWGGFKQWVLKVLLARAPG